MQKFQNIFFGITESYDIPQWFYQKNVKWHTTEFNGEKSSFGICAFVHKCILVSGVGRWNWSWCFWYWLSFGNKFGHWISFENRFVPPIVRSDLSLQVSTNIFRSSAPMIFYYCLGWGKSCRFHLLPGMGKAISVFSCPGSSIPDLGHSLTDWVTATFEFWHKKWLFTLDTL